MIQRFIDHLRELWVRFIEAHDPPHSMAGGMAIGVFFGFIPVFGFKTLIALGTSFLMRCNLIAAVVGVTLHDIFFLFWPFLFRFEFQLGHWLLSHPHQFAPRLARTDFRLSEIMNWDIIVNVIYPTFIGSMIIAIPFTLFAYGVTLLFMLYREKRHPHF